MKKTLIAIAGVLAFGTTAAWAAEADMSVAYGNTINVQQADGTNIDIIYNEDGTYASSGTAADGSAIEASGAWEIKGEQLCTTPAEGEEECADVEWGHSVGDSWQNADGDTITINEGQ